jgi:hypothetical protein
LYRAALPDGRPVALRLLGGDADAHAHERRDHLLRILSALSVHPHVAGICGWGRTLAGQSYVLTELGEEGSLADWVAAYGRLPWSEVVDLSTKVADALATAHRAGFVHGALGADQIWLSADGEPRLLGLDEVVRRALAGQKAPEVSEDIAGIGRTIATLLTGHPAAAPVDRHLEQAEAPSSLRALVARCLGDRRGKPTAMREVSAALTEIRSHDGRPPRPDGTLAERDLAETLIGLTAPEPEPDGKRRRSSRAPWRSLERIRRLDPV